MAYRYTFGLEESVVPLRETVLEAFLKAVKAAGAGDEIARRLPLLVGRDDAAIAAALERAVPGFDGKTLLKIKNKKLRDLVNKRDLAPTPGVREAVEFLVSSGEIPVLGTSLKRSFAIEVVRHVGLDDIFHHGRMICADDVEESKPAKWTYLAAVALHQVPPSRHVVFEGTVFGIESAAASGSVPVAVPVSGPASSLFQAAGAVHVVTSWAEVLDSMRRGAGA